MSDYQDEADRVTVERVKAESVQKANREAREWCRAQGYKTVADLREACRTLSKRGLKPMPIPGGSDEVWPEGRE